MELLVNERYEEAANKYRQAYEAFERARLLRVETRREARLSGAPRNHEAEEAYGVARHNVMMALFDLESEDMEALSRKLRYMGYARLPPKYKLDEVLYYIDHRRRVHLFYGGRLSPVGFGDSPDGRGHAHVMLERDGRGGYAVEYHRRPR